MRIKFREVNEIHPREGVERNLNQMNNAKSNSVGFDDPAYAEEFNRVGFDDPITPSVTDEDTSNTNSILSSQNKSLIKQVFAEKNKEIESRIAQLDSFDYVDNLLVEAITSVYGKDLESVGLIPSTLVDAFLSYNEFEGAESYRKLCDNIEDTLLLLKGVKTYAQQAEAKKLSTEDIEKITNGYANLKAEGDLCAKFFIRRKAKEYGVDPAELLQMVRKFGKSKINNRSHVLHYHRTSLERVKEIVAAGQLLNRDNLKSMGYDTSKFNGSSSNDIQFSVDKYNQQGELISAGFDIVSNLGAASSDVVFVMGPELMKEASYDCFGMYPTVEKANIDRCCVSILAKNEQILNELDDLLAETDLVMPTLLQTDFDRQAFSDAADLISRNEFNI